MTFIQSNHHKNSLTVAVLCLMVALFTATIGLIVIYNKVVDLNHAIAADKVKLDSIGAESTKLQNRIVALSGGGEITNIAGEDGLVLDNQPEYFPVPAAAAKQAVAVR